MAAQSAKGIILRKYTLRETSYILNIFTREFGKIEGVIKGVRAPYPQFGGNFEPITECQILFYRKKKSPLDLITQCETINSFISLRKDIERLTYANYFIELVNIVTASYEPNEVLYTLLVESLKAMGTPSSAKRTSRIFELRLLCSLGLEPGIEKCVKCGSIPEKARFSIKEGGLLCAGCMHRDALALAVSPGTIKFMHKILHSGLDKASHIKVSKDIGKELEKILKGFIEYHIGRPIKSMGFLEELEKAGVV